MRWGAKDPYRWRNRLAFLPVKIGDEWVWWEWFKAIPHGEFTEVCTLEDWAANYRDEPTLGLRDIRDDRPTKGEMEWAKLHSFLCESGLCEGGFRIDESTADVVIRLLKQYASVCIERESQ